MTQYRKAQSYWGRPDAVPTRELIAERIADAVAHLMVTEPERIKRSIRVDQALEPAVEARSTEYDEAWLRAWERWHADPKSKATAWITDPRRTRQ